MSVPSRSKKEILYPGSSQGSDTLWNERGSERGVEILYPGSSQGSDTLWNERGSERGVVKENEDICGLPWLVLG